MAVPCAAVLTCVPDILFAAALRPSLFTLWLQIEWTLSSRRICDALGTSTNSVGPVQTFRDADRSIIDRLGLKPPFEVVRGACGDFSSEASSHQPCNELQWLDATAEKIWISGKQLVKGLSPTFMLVISFTSGKLFFSKCNSYSLIWPFYLDFKNENKGFPFFQYECLSRLCFKASGKIHDLCRISIFPQYSRHYFFPPSPIPLRS